MKKIWILNLVVICLLIVAGIVLIWNAPDRSFKDIRVGSAAVKVEIAATLVQLEQGLSDRPSLPAGQGMLFVIDPPHRPGFWMKDMKFPLDIVYLRGGQVVDIKENVPPPLAGVEPEPFAPLEDTDAVLEVNAGWVSAHGVKIGDPAEY